MVRRRLALMPAGGSGAGGGAPAALRVLLVDDSPVARAVYRRLVARALEPAAVDVAASAAEALDALKAQPVDLVVSDYHMPGMDGLRFLGLVAERGLARRRILFSSDTDAYLPARALEAGAHAFIAKGDPCAFVERIRAAGAPLRAMAGCAGVA